ncbi:penicillin-binding transpeptidase domain-containing protein, partial [Streptomyces sp. SID12501]
GGEPFKQKNESPQAFGYVTIDEAMRQSINVPFAQLIFDVGHDKVSGVARSTGILDESMDPDDNASFALGTSTPSAIRMADSYATFAASGTHHEPFSVTKVTEDGEELPGFEPPKSVRAMDDAIADNITKVLRNVVENGTGIKAKKLGRPAAGKTGTTSSNEYNWFVGYTPLRATAVWVGFPGEMRSMNRQTINGRTYYRGPYGSSIAGPTWSRFMTQVLAGAENPGFSNAGDREVFGERVAVPSVVGRSESDARGALERAGFRVSVSGEQVQSPYPA